MRRVAQWLTARIDPHRQLQPDDRQQQRCLLDRQRSGQAALDPAVLGSRDPGRTGDVGASQPSIETAVPQLAEHQRPEGAATRGPGIDASLACSHRLGACRWALTAPLISRGAIQALPFGRPDDAGVAACPNGPSWDAVGLPGPGRVARHRERAVVHSRPRRRRAAPGPTRSPSRPRLLRATTTRVTSRMTGPDDGLYAAMLQRGLSRRTFLKFSAAMAATLALPASYAPRIAAAVATAPRTPGHLAARSGLRWQHRGLPLGHGPTTAELVLDLLSVEYHETIMTPAGHRRRPVADGALEAYPNGTSPSSRARSRSADDGMYCTDRRTPLRGRRPRGLRRRPGHDRRRLVRLRRRSASCERWPTGAVGVGQVMSDARLINLPGCPLNVENLTATIVHYLTFKELPATDSRQRPLFAYGGLLHNQCERRAHFEFGEFVTAWGDEGSQKGWCLYKMGCKGPETFANCPTARYADGTAGRSRPVTGASAARWPGSGTRWALCTRGCRVHCPSRRRSRPTRSGWRWSVVSRH